jgi:hypothetical protein
MVDARARSGVRDRQPVSNRFIAAARTAAAQSLLLLEPDSNKVEVLLSGAELASLCSFAVSPDRRWIVFTSRLGLGIDRYPEIRGVSTAGGQSFAITDWQPEFRPCYWGAVFSADGTKLACHHSLEDEGNPDIQILSLTDLGDRLYASRTADIVNPHRIGNHGPHFLPDDRLLYFGNFAYEDLLEVCMYEPGGKSEGALWGVTGRRLTYGADGIWRCPQALAFAPEWEQVFLIRGHTRSHCEICVFGLGDVLPGAGAHALTPIGGKYSMIRGMQLSPDKKLLLFEADDAIYIMETDGAGLRRISDLPARRPVFSPDGSRIAFLSGGKLYIIDWQGRETAMPHAAGLQIDSFLWM